MADRGGRVRNTVPVAPLAEEFYVCENPAVLRRASQFLESRSLTASPLSACVPLPIATGDT